MSFPRLSVGGKRISTSGISIMPSKTLTWNEHLELLGSAEPYFDSLHHITKQLSLSEINGRGGAGFPLSRKVASYSKYKGKVVVVANGSESEFHSRKDKALLLRHPHLIIDGLSILGSALGSKVGYVHLKSFDSPEGKVVMNALEERQGLDTFRIEISSCNPEVGYPSGTESAVISAIENLGGRPLYFPDRPIVRGIKRRPTMISNVETLAQLALLARFGSSWYSSIGTRLDPGSRLITVSQPTGNYNVLEVVNGLSIQEVVSSLGISWETMSCGLVGGYFGSLIPKDMLMNSYLSAPQMKESGHSLGAGVIALSDRCPVVETSEIISYLASQSAGQCGPCYMGLPRLASLWSELISGKVTSSQVALIDGVASQIIGRGGCSMPDGAVLMSRASIAYFKSELLKHQGGNCSYGKLRGRLIPSTIVKVG